MNFKLNNKITLNNDDVQLSKLMSWILRHGAIKERLPIDINGYIDINVLLKHPKFQSKNYTFNDIERIIRNDEKQRYSLLIVPQIVGTTTNDIYNEKHRIQSTLLPVLPNATFLYKIRANQGHSMSNAISLHLDEICNPDEYPIVVHGTYYRYWSKIQLEGLKRMARQHIHFAVNDECNKNISGFRSNCEILIYINVKKAMDNKIRFFRSDNNVILTEGLNGILSKEYFDKVIDRKTGKIV